MKFEFATAARIVFGPGRISEAGQIAKEFGERALVVTGKNPDRAKSLLESLKSSGVEAFQFQISKEPTLQDIRDGCTIFHKGQAAQVIGFGGGSAIDAAKAIAALATNGGDPLDYIEVIGRNLPISKRGLPFIAIPTTAGSGAEVTRNAVLHSPEHEVKASLRSPHLFARVAIVDPELTLGLPPSLTASTGMDALTQLIEPFVSIRANVFTDSVCRQGLFKIGTALPRVFSNGADLSSRIEMSAAALFGGVALANAGLGAVHGFAAAIGGTFPDAPHGAVCAALLPGVMEMNCRALRARLPKSDAFRRYDEVAQMLTGNPEAKVDDGIRFVSELRDELKIPRLEAYGIRHEHLDDLVRKATNASSMKANPLQLTPSELREILESA